MIPTRENVLALIESHMLQQKCSLADISRKSNIPYQRLRDLRRGKALTMNATDWENLKIALGHAEQTVPVLGSVPAGKALECIADIEPEHYILYPKAKPHYFALRVAGDSMNLVARSGSFIVIDPAPQPLESLDGKFIVANICGEFTFKRLRLNPLRLEPYSSQPHETIFINSADDVHLVGKVIGHYDDLSEG